MDYMIFRMIDKSKEEALLSLVDEKGLTKRDLILILRTLELNPNIPVDVLDKLLESPINIPVDVLNKI